MTLSAAELKPPKGWRRVMSQTSSYDWRRIKAGWLALVGPQSPNKYRLVLMKDFDDPDEAAEVANEVMG